MKSIYHFPVLVLIIIVLTFFSNAILNMDVLVFNSLSEKMTEDQVSNILAFNQKWQWVSYALLPLILALKITLISAVLYMGIFFFEKKINYYKLFAIVTKAEFVFIIVMAIKLLWFISKDNYTLEDVSNFYPLSALTLLGNEGLEPWFVYPFQTLNLFELAYWIILAWLLGKEIQSTTDKALKIVASSYGSALLIWVVAVMFLTLNMS